ncbi:hypothetical protein K474DRAFT_1604071 [Panus rudis PR-1116 ss-1]|nr:hypothetical protein K474DRAFT_1604071 [Panus rudis PR-1116 ss-1]
MAKKKKKTAAKADKKRQIAQQAAQHRREEAARQRLAQRDEAKIARKQRCHHVLNTLLSEGLNIGDFFLYVSDPTNPVGTERHNGLFKRKGVIAQILDFWTSSQSSETARATVHEWVMGYMEKVCSMEGEMITDSGILRSDERAYTDPKSHSLDNFSLRNVFNNIRDACPSMTRLLQVFCTTKRQERRATDSVIAKKENLIASAMSILLAARSQRNSLIRQTMGLYLYATGAQRQVFSCVLSHFGLSCSYTALVGTSDKRTTSAATSNGRGSGQDGRGLAPDAAVPTCRSGILRQWSHACKQAMRMARRLTRRRPPYMRDLAVTKLASYVYDNINLVLKVAEQILGRTDAQQNGTCATAFPLFNATPDDLQTKDLSASFDSAAPLSRDDILLSDNQWDSFDELLEYTTLRILVQHGGERFKRFAADVEKVRPLREDDIPLHKTDIYPLPAMDIDESSTTGNADVIDQIFKEAGYDTDSEEFSKTLKIIWGDQLSVKNLRSVTATRVGHDSAANSLLDNVYAPGLFHYEISATSCVLETHYGDPQLYTANPGSLCNHNNRIGRKPIVLSSLPPYRTCRDLIFVSLYARIFHCLELVSNKSLDEYAPSVTFDQLRKDIKTLLALYANTVVPQNAEDFLDASPAAFATGDMVYENAILFICDALILRAFIDSIKSGASGCIVLTLKQLALMYRGSSHSKYAYEVMHLIHNLTSVWPKPLRNIILQNWLVNPTGKPNAWVPVDLMQEHMNYWIKVIYKAHGSNATIEWLQMISPCIDTLRKLATQMNQELGSRQGTKHTTPDIWRDINELMKSLHEHSVYRFEAGRTIPGDKAEVPNLFTVGLDALKKPLKDYNIAFQKLQARRRMKPLLGEPASTTMGLPVADVAHTEYITGAADLETSMAVQGHRAHMGESCDMPENGVVEVAGPEGVASDDDDDGEEEGSDHEDGLTLSRENEDDVDLYMD